MTPPPEPAHSAQARNWFYAVAWMGAAVVATGITLWLVSLIRWGWPADLAAQQLTILGNALYGALALIGMVTFGLTLRNAIRNIKGSAGGVTLQATGKDDEP